MMFEATQHPQADLPQPDVSDISVAVLYPGNRIQKMQVPLDVSDLTVDVEPANPYNRDIVICDNADRDLGKEVLRKPTHDAHVVYRMRGDVFHELDLWGMHPVKHYIAENVVLQYVDGCLAVSDRLARKFHSETGNPNVGTAELWKRPAEWPDVDHTKHQIQALTLTNTNYWQKVAPIVKWAPIVDDVLAESGGTWRVCGGGKHQTRLAKALKDYENVTFEGFVNAKRYLSRSNVLLHPSNLDGQPNSVLEGMASNLPVVTTKFDAFTEFAGPILTADEATIAQELRELVDPACRETLGEKGIEYMESYHTPEAIAKQYERFCYDLIHGSD